MKIDLPNVMSVPKSRHPSGEMHEKGPEFVAVFGEFYGAKPPGRPSQPGPSSKGDSIPVPDSGTAEPADGAAPVADIDLSGTEFEFGVVAGPSARKPTEGVDSSPASVHRLIHRGSLSASGEADAPASSTPPVRNVEVAPRTETGFQNSPRVVPQKIPVSMGETPPRWLSSSWQPSQGVGSQPEPRDHGVIPRAPTNVPARKPQADAALSRQEDSFQSQEPSGVVQSQDMEKVSDGRANTIAANQLGRAVATDPSPPRYGKISPTAHAVPIADESSRQPSAAVATAAWTPPSGESHVGRSPTLHRPLKARADTDIIRPHKPGWSERLSDGQVNADTKVSEPNILAGRSQGDSNTKAPPAPPKAVSGDQYQQPAVATQVRSIEREIARKTANSIQRLTDAAGERSTTDDPEKFGAARPYMATGMPSENRVAAVTRHPVELVSGRAGDAIDMPSAQGLHVASDRLTGESDRSNTMRIRSDWINSAAPDADAAPVEREPFSEISRHTANAASISERKRADAPNAYADPRGVRVMQGSASPADGVDPPQVANFQTHPSRPLAEAVQPGARAEVLRLNENAERGSGYEADRSSPASSERTMTPTPAITDGPVLSAEPQNISKTQVPDTNDLESAITAQAGEAELGFERFRQLAPHVGADRTIPPRSDMPPRVADQLVQVARTAADGPVEITLRPEELGRVRMHLTAVDQSVTLVISAERPETLDLMRRNIDQLAQDYRDLGYENVSFSFGAGGDTDKGRQDARDGPAVIEAGGGEADPDSHTSASPMAQSDRVDIRL